jgi:hypothetical protein
LAPFLVLAALLARDQPVWKIHESRMFQYTVRVPPHWYVAGGESDVISLTDFPPNQFSTGAVRPSGGAQIIVGPLAAWGQTKASGISAIEAWIRANTRLAEGVSRAEIPLPKGLGWEGKSCTEVSSRETVGLGGPKDYITSDYCMFRGEPFQAALLCRENDPKQTTLISLLHEVLNSVRETP